MKKCIICGKRMRAHKLEQLVRCPKCGYICADCELDNEKCQKLYDADFWKGGGYTDYVSDKDYLKRNFRRRIKRLVHYIDHPEEKDVFEIGCAYGFFLEEGSAYFNEMSGIDISEPAVKYAEHSLKRNPKVKVYKGDYLEHALDKKVDLICLWDTIEHLKNPDEYIKKAYTDLNKGGILAVTTGDIGSMNARMRGKKWRQYCPPVHLQYFTKRSIKNLLAKYQFDLLDLSYIWNEMSLNNALYIMLCIRSDHKKTYDFLARFGIKKVRMYINLRDYMYVIARKK